MCFRKNGKKKRKEQNWIYLISEKFTDWLDVSLSGNSASIWDL